MNSVGESMTVVHDIRTTDLQPGVLELNPIEIVTERQGFPPKEGQIVEPNVRDLEQIHRVGEAIANRLRTHGFDSIGAVAAADHDELSKVTGIGKIRAQEIRQSAKQLLGVMC